MKSDEGRVGSGQGEAATRKGKRIKSRVEGLKPKVEMSRWMGEGTDVTLAVNRPMMGCAGDFVTFCRCKMTFLPAFVSSWMFAEKTGKKIGGER